MYRKVVPCLDDQGGLNSGPSIVYTHIMTLVLQYVVYYLFGPAWSRLYFYVMSRRIPVWLQYAQLSYFRGHSPGSHELTCHDRNFFVGSCDICGISGTAVSIMSKLSLPGRICQFFAQVLIFSSPHCTWVIVYTGTSSSSGDLLIPIISKRDNALAA